MGEAKTKKKKPKEQVNAEGSEDIAAKAETVLKVQNRKIAELDQQNTILQAMVIERNTEIEALRAALDALASESKNREQRRKVAKKNGK